MRKPFLFCLCGPTGCGKTSIAVEVMGRVSGLRRSLSTTTRNARTGEVDGEHYHFISRGEFYKKIAAGDFLEYATYNENLYGTETRNISEADAEGSDLLLTIDVQGVESFKKLYAEKTVVISVFPPSINDLKERLRDRGTESEERISERLAIAERELGILNSPGFANYRVVNDKLENAVLQVEKIIATERNRSS